MQRLLLVCVLCALFLVGCDSAALVPTAVPPTLTPITIPTSFSGPTKAIAPLPTDVPLPVPTDTAVPPTVAPTTPPTEVIKSFSADEQAYKTKSIEWNSQYSKSFNKISELSKDPKFGDSNWVIDLSVEFASIQGVDKEIVGYNPPVLFSSVHSKMVTGAKHYENYTRLMIRGLDESDPALIGQATDELNLGSTAVGEASIELDKITP